MLCCAVLEMTCPKPTGVLVVSSMYAATLKPPGHPCCLLACPGLQGLKGKGKKNIDCVFGSEGSEIAFDSTSKYASDLVLRR